MSLSCTKKIGSTREARPAKGEAGEPIPSESNTPPTVSQAPSFTNIPRSFFAKVSQHLPMARRDLMVETFAKAERKTKSEQEEMF
jgi:hypothetical protein